MGQASDHQAGHCQVNHGFAARGQDLIILTQPPTLRQPRECPLNGLIINDKFCLTRPAQLQLDWPRAQLRGHQPGYDTSDYPPDVTTHRGGSDETTMACLPHDNRPSARPTALGSRLSAPPPLD